jgi:hypothetical protein
MVPYWTLSRVHLVCRTESNPCNQSLSARIANHFGGNGRANGRWDLCGVSEMGCRGEGKN